MKGRQKRIKRKGFRICKKLNVMPQGGQRRRPLGAGASSCLSEKKTERKDVDKNFFPAFFNAEPTKQPQRFGEAKRADCSHGKGVEKYHNDCSSEFSGCQIRFTSLQDGISPLAIRLIHVIVD
ncbi:hypothetical protein GGTG_11459 [Gaeumannomyces tritici R3-111a-1]|uniref:Uncharacterized protein n=1 Tax=Gaeumannomyces tritici (strain R3-111a-1) TaxID=644352 RepID=J3PD90_GAET3|nr:hypothetical protein GGTG_11459 [Gaeumannomyces tritici R3-111a-1]EJT70435.1 hypothetical protein GGTG_11459 [Gaeumannomyces tritici R3-111a-1]